MKNQNGKASFQLNNHKSGIHLKKQEVKRNNWANKILGGVLVFASIFIIYKLVNALFINKAYEFISILIYSVSFIILFVIGIYFVRSQRNMAWRTCVSLFADIIAIVAFLFGIANIQLIIEFLNHRNMAVTPHQISVFFTTTGRYEDYAHNIRYVLQNKNYNYIDKGMNTTNGHGMRNTIRYFHKNNKKLVESISNDLRDTFKKDNLSIGLTNLSWDKSYSNVKNNTFEIWVGEK